VNKGKDLPVLLIGKNPMTDHLEDRMPHLYKLTEMTSKEIRKAEKILKQTGINYELEDRIEDSAYLHCERVPGRSFDHLTIHGEMYLDCTNLMFRREGANLEFLYQVAKALAFSKAQHGHNFVVISPENLQESVIDYIPKNGSTLSWESLDFQNSPDGTYIGVRTYPFLGEVKIALGYYNQNPVKLDSS